MRGYEAFVATAAIAGQDPVETTRLLATEIERARRFGFTTEELDAAKRDVLNRYTEAAAERETSDSNSLAEELGRHFFTDEPVPGIMWEYERVKEIVPSLTLEAVNAHAVMVLSEAGSQPFVMVAAPAALGATEAALRNAVTEVLNADITPYRGVKMETQLLEQNPAAGKLVSETSDAALGMTTLAYANGVRVVLKPTTYKSDEVVLSAGRYGGQYLYDEPDHQNAVHLVQTVEAMGYGSLSPTALQRFLSTRRADAGLSFTPYTEEVDGRSTRDDIATLLQLVYLKLTAPRLDAPRFEANRTAIEGYLASLWNSPMTQYRGLHDGDPVAGPCARAARAEGRPTSRRWTRREPWRCTANGSAMRAGSRSCWWAASRWRKSSPSSRSTWAGFPRRRGPSQFRDVGVRYPTGQIDRTLRAGSDNSAVSIVYSGERPYSAKASLDLAG